MVFDWEIDIPRLINYNDKKIKENFKMGAVFYMLAF